MLTDALGCVCHNSLCVSLLLALLTSYSSDFLLLILERKHGQEQVQELEGHGGERSVQGAPVPGFCLCCVINPCSSYLLASYFLLLILERKQNQDQGQELEGQLLLLRINDC